MKVPLTALSWLLALALACGGCVVSTHGGTGSSPTVPLPPELEEGPSAAPTGPVQIGAAHFLISYKGAERAAPYIERTKVEAAALAAELRQQVLDGADFEKVAAEHSDDRGSAAQGGKLGVFRREQMVPSFSQAAFALDVGQISVVVESAFGYHVILRTE